MSREFATLIAAFLLGVGIGALIDRRLSPIDLTPSAEAGDQRVLDEE